jgi:hypothetical protein
MRASNQNTPNTGAPPPFAVHDTAERPESVTPSSFSSCGWKTTSVPCSTWIWRRLRLRRLLLLRRRLLHLLLRLLLGRGAARERGEGEERDGLHGRSSAAGSSRDGRRPWA